MDYFNQSLENIKLKKCISTIDITKLKKNQYYKLCDIYIDSNTNSCLTLYNINYEILTDHEYYILCKKTIDNNTHNIYAVNIDKLSLNNYFYDILEMLVNKNITYIKYVNFFNRKITAQQYYCLCNLILNKYKILKYIDSDRIKNIEDYYYKICKIAVYIDESNLEFIDRNSLSCDLYHELYEIANNKK